MKKPEPSGRAEMPYERFLKYGGGSLSNAELLAIMLRTGSSGDSALDLAHHILCLKNEDGKEESLLALYHLSLRDLMSVRGIGEVKAVRLLCLTELSRRLSLEKAEEKLVFTDPKSVADYYMESLRHEEREIVLLLLLDNQLRLLREEKLSVGTVNCSLLSPREVFLRALEGGAVSILLLHNHPSGIAAPSDADISITKRIRDLGAELEIPLVDHIIIGDLCYTSMKEAGVL